jgi:hypothetical protein
MLILKVKRDTLRVLSGTPDEGEMEEERQQVTWIAADEVTRKGPVDGVGGSQLSWGRYLQGQESDVFLDAYHSLPDDAGTVHSSLGQGWEFELILRGRRRTIFASQAWLLGPDGRTIEHVA